MKNYSNKILKTTFYLALLMLPSIVIAQNITVQGIIKDSAGEPLIGATVVVENTSTGSSADHNGKFKITAPSKAVLVFSYIGYVTQRVNVNNRSTINIVMKEDALMLDEVVVEVGYGTMRRSDLTGSVTSISSKNIENSIATTVDQALQGRIAGLQMTQNSGVPGGGTSIQIRGVGSINSTNEPIYVVDGVVISGRTGDNDVNAIAGINPTDIESIEVLKDASAAAIYGAQGANGVILITMKKGRDAHPTINFNTKLGLQELPKKLDVLNLREYAERHNSYSDLLGYGHRQDFAYPEKLGKGTDWQDEIYRLALVQNYDLSVRGGNKTSTYFISAGLADQEGIVFGSDFQRFTLRANVDSQIRSWLKMGVTLNPSYTKQSTAVSSWSVIGNTLFQSPAIPVKNPDGSWGGPSSDLDGNLLGFSNPLAVAQLNQRNREDLGIRGNVYLQIIPTKWMDFRTEFTSDGSISNYQQLLPAYQIGSSIKSETENRHEKTYRLFWGIKNILNLHKTFGKKHRTSLMIAHEVRSSKSDYLMGERRKGSSELPGLNAGDESYYTKNAGNGSENRIVSIFGRATYNFDDRYLFTGTIRRDGSSNFAAGNQWGTFPSAAIAWRVSEERFFSSIKKVVNNMKLRLSYGVVGNSNVSAFAYESRLSNQPTNSWGVAFQTANTSNPDITWETTKSWNAGLDLNLFDNRVELIVDAYIKKTEDLLLRLSLPGFTGSGASGVPGSPEAPWYNIGAIENKGFELTLNTHNVKSKNFNWYTATTFTLNRNEVTRMNTSTAVIPQTDWSDGTNTITRTMVGFPVSEFYGYKYIGRINSAADYLKDNGDGTSTVTKATVKLKVGDIVNNTDENLINQAYVGDLLFEDMNDDGIINEQDLTNIGSPFPNFTFGIGNTFTYRDFDLTVFLNGSVGGKVYNILRSRLDNPNGHQNISRTAGNFPRLGYLDGNSENTDVWNVYVLPGSEPDIPRQSVRDANNNKVFSDRYVEDGSFLRIQNISFGYRLPKKLISKLKINSLRIYTNLQNVYTFTGYSGYNPEVGSKTGQSMLQYGVDGGIVPSPRIYTFGIDLTF
ncbi:SusC/RagA family TonB-linked outer membrane protein [Bacteroides sp. UBA939]|uniref:SusC/RagA family TonB-linked outer membrane protein n=1 Tax=Bacteroides sp. UBA939 TaxID=1946092 RepID=UPI0025B8A7D3|nr:TonB-dependent receptor [Bacteroides sp. UBA939]